MLPCIPKPARGPLQGCCADADHTLAANPHALVGRDVYGLSLGYYGDNDYQAIDGSRWSSVSDRPFAPMGTMGSLAAGHRPLYNGNIAHTTNTLAPFGGYPNSAVAPGQVLAMVYTYDQLNRLRQAQGVTGLGTGNSWDGVTEPTSDLYKSAYSYDANGNILGAERYDQHGARYDEFQYHYQRDGAGRPLRNRLYQLNDLADEDNERVNAIPDGSEDIAWTGDVAFDPLDPNINTAYNYGYDALGNLVRDDRERIALIEWTVAGKVSAVHRPAGSGKQSLRFTYGANGQRIVKEVRNDADEFLYREHYIRDAQGNLMATYRHALLPIGPPEPGTEASLKLTERPIYGSSRLGVDAQALELGGLSAESPNPYLLEDPIGRVHYELTDHLGNVATVITDELVAVDVDADTETDHFQPFVVSAQGYEPFGSLLPGRNYSSDAYRFGFNGQEKDNEVYGSEGTSYTAEFWQYDPRVARRWNLDPVVAPWESGYAAFRNNPIFLNDPSGDCPDCEGGDEKPGFESGVGTDENPIQLNEFEVSTKADWAQISINRRGMDMLRESTAAKIPTGLGPDKRGSNPYAYDGKYDIFGHMVTAALLAPAMEFFLPGLLAESAPAMGWAAAARGGVDFGLQTAGNYMAKPQDGLRGALGNVNLVQTGLATSGIFNAGGFATISSTFSWTANDRGNFAFTDESSGSAYATRLAASGTFGLLGNRVSSLISRQNATGITLGVTLDVTRTTTSSAGVFAGRATYFGLTEGVSQIGTLPESFINGRR